MCNYDVMYKLKENMQIKVITHIHWYKSVTFTSYKGEQYNQLNRKRKYRNS